MTSRERNRWWATLHPGVVSLRADARGLATMTSVVVVTLPAFERASFGFDVASAVPRRVVVLVMGLVVSAIFRSGPRWLRWLSVLIAPGLLLALDWRSVAGTLALSLVLAELSGVVASSEIGGEETRTRLGLVASVLGVAVLAGSSGAAVLVTTQAGLIVLVLVAPRVLERVGDVLIGARERIRTLTGASVADANGAVGVGRTTWSQFPSGASQRSTFDLDASRAFLGAVTTVAVAAPALALPWEVPMLLVPEWILVVVIATALGFVRAVDQSGWRTGPDVAILVALAIVGGTASAVTCAMSLALVEVVASAAVRDAATTGRAPRNGASELFAGLVAVSVAIGVVAELFGSQGRIAAQMVALFVSAGPAGLSRAAGAVGRVVAALRAGIGAVGGALMVVLWVPLVFGPWIVDRVARWDPLWAPRSPGSTFVRRDIRATESGSMWIPPTSVGRRPRRSLARRRLVIAGAAVAMVFAADAVAGMIASLQDPTPAPAALANAPWWPAAQRAQHAAFDRSRLNFFVGPTLADIRSPTTNVTGGRRATWKPPVEPKVRVWIFGGSTLFGLGQRDDHTIASEFAKRSWEQGIAVEATNFGVPGDVHWTELQRLRQALRSAEPSPDLVIFYDGWNDMFSHVDNADLLGADDTFRGGIDRRLRDERFQGSWIDDLLHGGAVDDMLVSTPTAAPRRYEELAAAGIVQYRESIEDSRSFLASQGFAGVYFLQPVLATRSTHVSGESVPDDRSTRAARRFVAQRPDGMVDLSLVFDDVASPVFWDSGHTNELGARVVGEAMSDHLLPQLREIAGTGP